MVNVNLLTWGAKIIGISMHTIFLGKAYLFGRKYSAKTIYSFPNDPLRLRLNIKLDIIHSIQNKVWLISIPRDQIN